MVGSTRTKTLLQLLAFMLNNMTIKAQQSAAGQDTLIALVGRDYVMMGADSSSSGGGGIALTSSNIDKLAVIHDGMSTGSISRFDAALRQQSIVVGFAGDAADGTKVFIHCIMNPPESQPWPSLPLYKLIYCQQTPF